MAFANFGNDVVITPVGTVITASTNTAGVRIDNKGTLRASIVATAATGTSPSVTLTVQTSHDNGATDAWRTAGSAFTAVTAAGTSAWQTMAIDRWVRFSYVVTGTSPSVTLGVLSEAV